MSGYVCGYVCSSVRLHPLEGSLKETIMRKIAIITAVAALVAVPATAQEIGAAGVGIGAGSFAAGGNFAAGSAAAGGSFAAVGGGNSSSSSGAAQISGSALTVGFGLNSTTTRLNQTATTNTRDNGTRIDRVERITGLTEDRSATFTMVGDTFTEGEDFARSRGLAQAGAIRGGFATAGGEWGVAGAGGFIGGFSTD